MTDRYFENTLQPSQPDDAEVVREILKAAAAALKEVKAAAVYHRDVSGGGMYVGVGGVALTYLRIAQQVQRGFRYSNGAYLRKHDVPHCLQLAATFLDEATKLMASKRVTFLEGASGVLAAQALLAHMQGDAQGLAAKVQELESLWPTRICGVLPDGECEVLYGRAGYLYSLAWLQQQLGRDVVPTDLIKSVVRHILDEGLRGAAELAQQSPAGGGTAWGLMYSWHDKRYLGGAHGVAGICYLLLHHMPLVQQLDRERAAAPAGTSGGISSSRRSYTAAVRACADALAGARLPSGNLPTKLGDTQDVRVAWCHGGAGQVLVMLKAAEVLGDDDGRYSAAAAAAGDDIWNRGLLKKGVGLCHGISGNGYALLALWRATGEGRYLAAAQAFGVFAARHWRELYDTPDRPASLYEGLAGAVNFWLDVVEHHQNSRWPGAEL